MTARMYYDNDADPAALAGQTVAIIGYGSAGPRPRPEPARDSGSTSSSAWRPARRAARWRRRPGCACRTSPMPCRPPT